MDDIDRSICGEADGRDRDCDCDLDLLGCVILTGRMFSNPRPDSMVVGRSSSRRLDPGAMRGGD